MRLDKRVQKFRAKRRPQKQMNLSSALIVLAALIGSAFAQISFNMPRYDETWYSKAKNYLNIISNNPLEQFATVSFFNDNRCMSLTVKVNHVIPIVLPRPLRSGTFLNVFAISNINSPAYTRVTVVDNLCDPIQNSCIKPCPSRRRGCNIYSAEDVGESASEEAMCAAETVYIPFDSEEAKALDAQQALAVQHLAEDIKLIEACNAEQEQINPSANPNTNTDADAEAAPEAIQQFEEVKA